MLADIVETANDTILAAHEQQRFLAELVNHMVAGFWQFLFPGSRVPDFAPEALPFKRTVRLALEPGRTDTLSAQVWQWRARVYVGRKARLIAASHETPSGRDGQKQSALIVTCSAALTHPQLVGP